MKKVLCMVAIATIGLGSVYAAPVQEKTTTAQVKKQTVSKKAIKKHSTRKVVKKDSVKL